MGDAVELTFEQGGVGCAQLKQGMPKADGPGLGVGKGISRGTRGASSTPARYGASDRRPMSQTAPAACGPLASPNCWSADPLGGLCSSAFVELDAVGSSFLDHCDWAERTSQRPDVAEARISYRTEGGIVLYHWVDGREVASGDD